MSLELPPPGLSGRELEEWMAQEQAKDKDRHIQLPEASGIDPAQAVKLGFLHVVFHPVMGFATDDYKKLYPYLWFACKEPGRPADEAMLIDDNCPLCTVEWDRRGLPISPLPDLPSDSPRYRDPVA